MNKKCSICKVKKKSTSFGKRGTWCKDCRKIYAKQYYLNNRQKVLNQNKTYREENKERALLRAKRYRDSHKDEHKEYRKEYDRENKTKIKKRSHEYYEDNKDSIRLKHKCWKENNKDWEINHYSDPIKKEKRKIYNKEWRRKNHKRVKEDNRKRINKRLKKDLSFAIKHKIGAAMRNAIKRGFKKTSAQILLGCSISEFKIYIESKFLPGMTWENWGLGMTKWNLDHIIPIAAFDMKKEEDQKKCWHYSNFQPLWQKDNIAKSDILPCGNRASEIGKVGIQYTKEIY